MLTARELMTTPVLSVDVDADCAEIVDLMLDHDVASVPVVDAEGRLVGVVSYSDVLRALPLEAMPRKTGRTA
jgi:CBS domain-containing protein